MRNNSEYFYALLDKIKSATPKAGDASNIHVRHILTGISKLIEADFCIDTVKSIVEPFLKNDVLVCPYSGILLNDLDLIAFDHIHPINQTSAGLHISENLIPCHAFFNSLKNDKTCYRFFDSLKEGLHTKKDVRAIEAVAKNHGFSFQKHKSENVIFLDGHIADERRATIQKVIEKYNAKNQVFSDLGLASELQKLYVELQKRAEGIIEEYRNKLEAKGIKTYQKEARDSRRASVRSSSTNNVGGGEEKIASYVRRKVAMLEENKMINDEILEGLLDKKFSQKTFGIKYAFFSSTKADRYHKTQVFQIRGNSYYITSEWFKNTNQREKFDQWLSENFSIN